MKRSVRLSLKKETLSDLTAGDLSGVAGGNSALTCNISCYTCPVGCIVRINEHSLDLTNCCDGIPTFHRGC